MNSWKIILATIVIFGAGVMTGGLLVNHIENANRANRRPPGAEIRPTGGEHEPGRGMEFPRSRQPELFSADYAKRLDDVLKLTTEQKNAIDKIIAEGQQRNREIWRTNAAPPMRQVMIETRQQIRQLLTPDQQKQFDQLMRHAPRRPPNATNAPPTSIPAAAPAGTNAPGA